MTMLNPFPSSHPHRRPRVCPSLRTVFAAMFFACVALVLSPLRASAAVPTEPRGTLLVIGGALEKDNRAVYARFVELASAASSLSSSSSPSPNPLRIVIATAASGEPEKSGESAKATIASYAPSAEITVVHASTDAGATVAAFNGATGVFFTGGDQSRITARYRPPSPPSASADPAEKAEETKEIAEMAALRGVLARGGVIAGTSAGAAMMGEEMFTGGSSAEALGVAKSRKQREEPGGKAEAAEPAPSADGQQKNDDDTVPSASSASVGPRLAPGMGLVSGILTDSHFFERDRVGRLVVALKVIASREGKKEAGGATAYGLGVAENACVEIDLAKRELRGVSEAPSLLVDARRSRFGVWARREAGVRSENARSPLALPVRGCVGRLIRRGEVIRLAAQVAGHDAEFRQNEPPFSSARPEGAATMLPRDEKERKSRRGSSGALFAMAIRERDTVWRLELDGWGIEARAGVRIDTPDSSNWIAFDLVKVDEATVEAVGEEKTGKDD